MNRIRFYILKTRVMHITFIVRAMQVGSLDHASFAVLVSFETTHDLICILVLERG